MSDPGLVAAAGAVVLRRKGDRTQVLLVHRARYDDWSLPKGKLAPGETTRAAAVREVHEETGVRIRLGPPLAMQVYRYDAGRRTKTVHYWVGRALGDQDVSGYRPNAEISGVRWVDLDTAASQLSYGRDRDTVAEAATYSSGSRPLLVVRHALAGDKKAWPGEDRERPLTVQGRAQGERLVPLLKAYGVRRLLSSSSTRCVETVRPYAAAAGLELETTGALSVEDQSTDGVARVLREARRTPAAVCTHRQVLPTVFDELHLDARPVPKAGFVVIHHRHGRLVALERVTLSASSRGSSKPRTPGEPERR